MEHKMNGTVKFYDATKGFGFITITETSTDIFVHATGLTETIKQGDAVSFDEAEGRKGKTAINVKVIK